MKIIVACDSYKGCMTSAQVADNITAAIHRVDPAIEVVSYTMADGGEGTAAAFCDACGGEMVEAATTNAYGRRISAQYALIEEGKTAVIEAAGCIGLAMHPREKRNPLMASSFGVGTLMLDAQARGCRRDRRRAHRPAGRQDGAGHRAAAVLQHAGKGDRGL